MLLEEFDANKTAIINPDMCVEKIENFPEVTISCFSEELFNEVLEFFRAKEIASVHSASGLNPIYEVTYKGKRFAMFKSMVGEPLCVGQYEEIIAMGSKRLILLGNCGVLDKRIEDCGIIIPIKAVRDEGTSYHYAKPCDTIDVNHNYRDEFKKVLKEFGYPYVEGITWTTDACYRETRDKIVNIDEAGSIDYIVYGYMNRGIHEGTVGIAVYHYDSLANTNEEQVFIPSSQSYEVMKSELGQLMYVTESGAFYIMVDGNVYGIDLNSLDTKVLVEGLSDEAVAISESNRFLAWVDPSAVRGSDTIHMIDFVTEKVTDVTGSASDYVKPLGFMQEDFVYGVAKSADVVVDAAGNTLFPMYQVKIMDTSSEEHEILKTYEKPGYYVQNITISGYTIYLNRIQNNGTAYVDADQDMIMNREGDSLKVVDIATKNTDEKETQVLITLQDEAKKKTPKILTPKETILEQKREVSLKEEKDNNRYYVYVKGEVVLTTDSVSDAIIAANSQMGVVIGENQQYVWKRSRKTAQAAFNDIVVGEEDSGAGSIAQCVNAILEKEEINISVSALISQGETPKQILLNTLKDATVLDLTGCTVDEILYYVSNGYPVFAMTGSSDAVLVVGYDANNVVLYDPAMGQTYKRTTADADEMFFNAGNIFFTYQK